jgi:large subunit ribosomal protein L21
MEGRYEFFCSKTAASVKRLFRANQVSLRMFAIIEDGSHQYRVAPGETLVVDYRDTANVGDSMQFEKVLLANGGGSSTIGRPLIEGASVSAEVIDTELKGEKLEIQKFRRRHDSKRHTGHRQKYTVVKITDISVPGLEVVETAAAE